VQEYANILGNLFSMTLFLILSIVIKIKHAHDNSLENWDDINMDGIK